ncbi:hypothetical protein Plhal710r2_c019g0081111 [Plasmopara halstedii]
MWETGKTVTSRKVYKPVMRFIFIMTAFFVVKAGAFDFSVSSFDGPDTIKDKFLSKTTNETTVFPTVWNFSTWHQVNAIDFDSKKLEERGLWVNAQESVAKIKDVWSKFLKVLGYKKNWWADLKNKLAYKWAWWRSNPKKAFELLPVVKNKGILESDPGFRDWFYRLAQLRRKSNKVTDEEIIELLRANGHAFRFIPLSVWLKKVPGMDGLAEKLLVDLVLHSSNSERVYNVWLDARISPETIYHWLDLENKLGATREFGEWLEYIERYSRLDSVTPFGKDDLIRLLGNKWTSLQSDPTASLMLFRGFRREGSLSKDEDFLEWLKHMEQLRGQGKTINDDEIAKLLWSMSKESDLVEIAVKIRDVFGTTALSEKILLEMAVVPTVSETVYKLWLGYRESPEKIFLALRLHDKVGNTWEFKQWLRYVYSYRRLEDVQEPFSDTKLLNLVMEGRTPEEAFHLFTSLRQYPSTKPFANTMLANMYINPVHRNLFSAERMDRPFSPQDLFKHLAFEPGSGFDKNRLFGWFQAVNQFWNGGLFHFEQFSVTPHMLCSYDDIYLLIKNKKMANEMEEMFKSLSDVKGMESFKKQMDIHTTELMSWLKKGTSPRHVFIASGPHIQINLEDQLFARWLSYVKIYREVFKYYSNEDLFLFLRKFKSTKEIVQLFQKLKKIPKMKPIASALLKYMNDSPTIRKEALS